MTTSETALQRAQELDERQPRGPLHGVPVVLKDNINTHDMPTAFGSIAMKGYRPHAGRDGRAPAARRGRGDHRQDDAAGLGDLVVQLLLADATRRATRTTPTAIPAARASGTGAAVAANLAAVGLGTDCGGSIRLPASFCNLVGVRSTPGRDPAHRHVLPRDPAGHGRPDGAHGRRRGQGLRGDRRLRPRRPLQRARRSPPARATCAQATLRGTRIGLVTNALGDDPGVTACIAQAVADLASRRAPTSTRSRSPTCST